MMIIRRIADWTSDCPKAAYVQAWDARLHTLVWDLNCYSEFGH